jgi:hypothetical protein
MGPTLLLDKSSFQALKSCEMHKLTNYFQWNIVDILLEEIRCDFLKETKPASSRNKASILADKYSPAMDSMQNVNYRELFIANLYGHEVVMDCIPIVASTTTNTLDDGQRIALIDKTIFGEMIRRWQKGEFDIQDKVFANIWKTAKDSSKADSCILFLQANHIIIPESKSIDELRIVVDKLLRNPKMQHVFLDMFLSYEDVDQTEKYNIKERLKRCPYSLSKVAPYAFYCLKVFVLFLGAYKFGLLLEKKTDDQIDLEYLFYLPFCHVFSSNDKFHATLAPPLMGKGQIFLPGENLKKGIREIESLPAHEETMKAQCAPIPPMPKESIIREVWLKTRWLYD